MNADASESGPLPSPEEPARWSRRRWWILVFIAFAAHLIFFAALQDRRPQVARVSVPSTVLNAAEQTGEMQALLDPTLFALPNRFGVAGLTWLRSATPSYSPYRWAEKPHWLTLPAEELGTTFSRFMLTNVFGNPALAFKPEPSELANAAPPMVAPGATRSGVRLTGGLAEREWLNAPALRSWPASDLLRNTTVQAQITAGGEVLSAALLPPRSGSRLADDYALQLVRNARFTPIPVGNELTLGTLVFEWFTEPAAPTNAP